MQNILPLETISSHPLYLSDDVSQQIFYLCLDILILQWFLNVIPSFVADLSHVSVLVDLEVTHDGRLPSTCVVSIYLKYPH